MGAAALLILISGFDCDSHEPIVVGELLFLAELSMMPRGILVKGLLQRLLQVDGCRLGGPLSVSGDLLQPGQMMATSQAG